MAEGNEIRDQDITFTKFSTNRVDFIPEMTMQSYIRIIRHFLNRYDNNVLKWPSDSTSVNHPMYRYLKKKWRTLEYDKKGLRKKRWFYKAVVEDGSDVIFIVDFDGKILYHNASVHETLGYRAKSLITAEPFDFILPASLEEFKASFRQTQKRLYTEKVEFQFL